jgi:hypothetical protein
MAGAKIVFDTPFFWHFAINFVQMLAPINPGSLLPVAYIYD